MKVVIDGTTYTKISNLAFIPETDVTGTKVPVNEFVVDIHTSDDIRNGMDVFLYDDINTLWAKYWIVYAERSLTEDGGTIIRVCGQSKITLLDRATLPAIMYSDTPVSSILATVFSPLGNNAYTLDPSFSSKTITGFCPEQSARDRLMWVCFVIGAYVKAYFTPTIDLLPVDDTEVMVPMEKTYYKPSVTYDDYVTKVSATVYSFVQGTPEHTDEWVTDGTNYYIVTKQEVSLSNPDVPVTATENIVSIQDVMIINSDNVDEILSHLAKYYFDRIRVDLDVIDNAEYMPGQKLLVYRDRENMVTGYAEQCSFTFGLQAKASIRLVAAAQKEAGNLVIIYMDGSRKIGEKKYSLPIGYIYSVLNPYIDFSIGTHRYIYRPVNQYATGTIESNENTNTQQCAVALDLDRSNGVLLVVSVDEVETQTHDEEVIGVIA